MRRLGAICLAFGLAAPAWAADPPPAEDTSVPWYRWLFLGERSKPAPTPPPATAAGPRVAPVANTPMPKETVARLVAEEHRVFLERVKVIDKIKEIANERNDEGLRLKAEELEAQAFELFQMRTAKLTSLTDSRDDRAALERGRDTRPATAERPPARRPSTRGGNR
jgi:hypothetical protein